jgi:hypothetical protein
LSLTFFYYNIGIKANPFALGFLCELHVTIFRTVGKSLLIISSFPIADRNILNA